MKTWKDNTLKQEVSTSYCSLSFLESRASLEAPPRLPLPRYDRTSGTITYRRALSTRASRFLNGARPLTGQWAAVVARCRRTGQLVGVYRRPQGGCQHRRRPARYTAAAGLWPSYDYREIYRPAFGAAVVCSVSAARTCERGCSVAVAV